LLTEQNQAIDVPSAKKREPKHQAETHFDLKFNSEVVKKVQEAELLSKFEFRVDKRFLVTAILTFIDYFASKPREFELLVQSSLSKE
jgi:hypothetical protein